MQINKCQKAQEIEPQKKGLVCSVEEKTSSTSIDLVKFIPRVAKLLGEYPFSPPSIKKNKKRENKIKQNKHSV